MHANDSCESVCKCECNKHFCSLRQQMQCSRLCSIRNIGATLIAESDVRLCRLHWNVGNGESETAATPPCVSSLHAAFQVHVCAQLLCISVQAAVAAAFVAKSHSALRGRVVAAQMQVALALLGFKCVGCASFLTVLRTNSTSVCHFAATYADRFGLLLISCHVTLLFLQNI